MSSRTKTLARMARVDRKIEHELKEPLEQLATLRQRIGRSVQRVEKDEVTRVLCREGRVAGAKAIGDGLRVRGHPIDARVPRRHRWREIGGELKDKDRSPK